MRLKLTTAKRQALPSEHRDVLFGPVVKRRQLTYHEDQNIVTYGDGHLGIDDAMETSSEE
jgi:hypothetical protein